LGEHIDEINVVDVYTGIVALNNVNSGCDLILAGARKLTIGVLDSDSILSEVIAEWSVSNQGHMAVASNRDLVLIGSGTDYNGLVQTIVR